MSGIDELLRNFDEFINETSGTKKRAAPNLDWTGAFTLSNEEKEMLTDPKFIEPDLIVQGHVIAIVAEPNGGKTTIMSHIAGEIAPDYQVYYVNADVSGADAKSLLNHAEAHGYELLLPDMKAGFSMDDVVRQIVRMNDVDADYSGIVFIFDTLKKMTDVINKKAAKELYKTLRGLSAKGMTIVLLAHTNKYADDDGKPIYEGTADLRSDIDELIYLVPSRHSDGSMTVSTLPDKKRADIKPITFEISADRTVRRADVYVDVVATRKAEATREKDEAVIASISEAIRSGKTKQTEIVAHCKAGGFGWRTVQRVLKDYSKPPLHLWTREPGFERNAWLHTLLDN